MHRCTLKELWQRHCKRLETNTLSQTPAFLLLALHLSPLASSALLPNSSTGEAYDYIFVNTETYLHNTTAAANIEYEFEPAVFMQAQVSLWIAYSEAHQQGTQCKPADSSFLHYCTFTVVTCQLTNKQTRCHPCVPDMTSLKFSSFACVNATDKPILTNVQDQPHFQ